MTYAQQSANIILFLEIYINALAKGRYAMDMKAMTRKDFTDFAEKSKLNFFELLVAAERMDLCETQAEVVHYERFAPAGSAQQLAAQVWIEADNAKKVATEKPAARSQESVSIVASSTTQVIESPTSTVEQLCNAIISAGKDHPFIAHRGVEVALTRCKTILEIVNLKETIRNHIHDAQKRRHFRHSISHRWLELCATLKDLENLFKDTLPMDVLVQAKIKAHEIASRQLSTSTSLEDAEKVIESLPHQATAALAHAEAEQRVRFILALNNAQDIQHIRDLGRHARNAQKTLELHTKWENMVETELANIKTASHALTLCHSAPWQSQAQLMAIVKWQKLFYAELETATFDDASKLLSQTQEDSDERDAAVSKLLEQARTPDHYFTMSVCNKIPISQLRQFYSKMLATCDEATFRILAERRCQDSYSSNNEQDIALLNAAIKVCTDTQIMSRLVKACGFTHGAHPLCIDLLRKLLELATSAK